MQAARFYGKRDIRVEEVPSPSRRLAEDEVLVAPIACGICGTDLHEYIAGPIVTPKEPNGFNGATLPQILGHEFSARVLDTGRNIKHVRQGDRVSIQPLIAPYDDYYARRGLAHLSERLGVVGLSWAWGGMGEQAIVRADNVYPVPDTLSDVQAALIEPGAVAVYAVDRGRVRTGSSVLVSGFGPIGALVMLAAKAAGATTIFVSEPNAQRREKAQEMLPSVIAIDPKAENVADVVRSQTESLVGADVALECVGNEVSLNACAAAVRRQGVVVQLGLHIGRPSVDAMQWAVKDITIEATWCFPVQSWPRIASMISTGVYPVESIVTAKIALRDVVEKGFEALLDPSSEELKVVVENMR